jgi:hypothetical protein
MHNILRAAIAATIVAAVTTAAFASPPPGHYGPTRTDFGIPQVEGTIYYAATNGSPDAEGATPDRPTTIEAAVARVTTGDAIVLRGGTYRTGSLVLNQGVTIQPYRDEHVTLKGTRVATEWEPVRGGLWRTKWDTLFPLPPQDWWRRESEITRTPLHKFNNDMVFVDGQMLHSTAWAGEVDRNSYWIDYDKGYVYIGINPENRLVEITAHDVAILRTIGRAHGKTNDRVGLTVLGIEFTQYAFRAIEIEGRDPEGPADENEYGNDVVGSRFEHCSFSYCSRVAGYFRGDNLIIRNCLVTQTGTEGIFVLASDDALLERNIVSHGNNEEITGYFATAIKIFNQCRRPIVRENLVHDHPGDSSGVWFDVGNHDAVFVDNRIERTDNAFFFEISQRALAAGNLFIDCNTAIKILNSTGVRAYNNTLVRSRVHIHRDQRSAEGDHFGWHPATGPGVDQRTGHRVVGNLFIGGADYREPAVVLSQVPAVSDQDLTTQLAELRGNVFVRRPSSLDTPLIAFYPARETETPTGFDTLDEFRAYFPSYAQDSTAFLDDRGLVFNGAPVGQYNLAREFPGATIAVPTPDGGTQPYPGALPPETPED